MQTSFYSRCPFHRRRCKCSYRQGEQTRARRVANIAEVSPLILVQPVSPAAIYSLGLQNVFLTGLLPLGTFSVANKVFNLDAWRDDRAVTVAAAVPALGLLQLDSVEKWDRAEWQARKSYIDMLRFQQGALLNKRVGIVPVVTAACMILNCEVYRTVSQSSTAYMNHIPAIVSLINHRSAELLAHPVGHVVMRLGRHVDIVHSLFTRKPTSVDTSTWYDVLRGPPPGGLERLYRLAEQTPTLLEATDRAISRPPIDYQILGDTIDRLEALRFALERWLLAYHEEFLIGNTPIQPSDLSGFPTFNKVINIPTPLFASPYAFPGALCALRHAFFWTILLNVSSALMSLITDAQKKNVLRMQAQSCADSLCASVPYLAETVGGNVAIACAVAGPLHHAKMWYRASGQLSQARWCQEAEQGFYAAYYTLRWEAAMPFIFVALLWLTDEEIAFNEKHSAANARNSL